MSAFGQYLVQGLAAGSFYALAALGLAVIFGVLGVVNFAHGACYMLGAVISAVLLDTLGLGFWAALVVVLVIMFGAGLVLERCRCAGWRSWTRCTTSCSPSASRCCWSTWSNVAMASRGCPTPAPRR